ERTATIRDRRAPMSDPDVPRQLAAVLDVLGFDDDSLFETGGGPNREKVVAWLYRILDTLDSKTSHLLRFASLLLAAQTFLAGLLIRDFKPPLVIVVVALFLLVFPLAAAISGLYIFSRELAVLRQGAAIGRSRPGRTCDQSRAEGARGGLRQARRRTAMDVPVVHAVRLRLLCDARAGALRGPASLPMS